MAKSGRKKIKDKAVPLTVYVRKSVINEKGGANECRKSLKEYADSGFPDLT